MPAAHEVAVEVTGTTADVRRLLDYVDAHAPATAVVSAVEGKLVARWSTEPTEAPVRGSTTALGFGPQPSAPFGFAPEVRA